MPDVYRDARFFVANLDTQVPGLRRVSFTFPVDPSEPLEACTLRGSEAARRLVGKAFALLSGIRRNAGDEVGAKAAMGRMQLYLAGTFAVEPEALLFEEAKCGPGLLQTSVMLVDPEAFGRREGKTAIRAAAEFLDRATRRFLPLYVVPAVDMEAESVSSPEASA
jgi:hypothetical protein